MELVELEPFDNQTLLSQGQQRLEEVEVELFRLREAAENIWIRIAELCAEVVEYKLYKYAKDEDGNYFRTFKKYFEYLDEQWRQRGWHARPSTLNHWMSTYHLFVKEMGFTPDEVATLGVTNAKALAPAVRQLLKEGRTDEVQEAVSSLITVAQVHGGIPTREVHTTIDLLTGRVDKSLEVRFGTAVFGYHLDVLRLWWGGKPYDLLKKQQITETQRDWVLRRTGQPLDE